MGGQAPPQPGLDFQDVMDITLFLLRALQQAACGWGSLPPGALGLQVRWAC